MPDGGRRSNVDKPVVRSRPKLSPLERFQRGRVIAEMRSRQKPVAWGAVAKEVGMSVSGAKSAYAQFLEWEEPQHDPLAVVQETIDSLVVTMHEAMRNAEHAPAGSAARTQALRLAMDASLQKLTVMRSAGRAPRSLAMPTLAQAMQLVFRRFAEVLERHHLPDEVIADLLSLAEQQIDGTSPLPDVEGTAREAPVLARA